MATVIEHFHFIRPDALWLLLLVPVIYRWSQRAASHQSAWLHVCDKALYEILNGRRNGSGQRFSISGLLTALSILMIIALCGPSWQRDTSPLLEDNNALIIALDLSTSMLAHDVAPSRYVRARYKIADILNARRSGHVALIAYAADAFAVTPLTTDAATVSALLHALSPQMMPTQGSNPVAALEQAIKLKERSKLEDADLLLITDGVGPEHVDALITKSQESTIRISVLGIATEEGASVPNLNDIGFIMQGGQTVIAKLESESLDALARETNGQYCEFTDDESDVRKLSKLFDKNFIDPKENENEGNIVWKDMGPYFLFPALIIAAFLFRKNLLFCLLISVMLLHADPLLAEELVESSASDQAQSNSFEESLKTRNQRGLEAFIAEDYALAQKLFTDKRWRAATAYRLDQFEDAYELYKQFDDVEAIYNRGNCLVFLSRWQDAVQEYNRALKIDPDHEDAKFNLEQVLGLMNKMGSSKNNNSQRGDDKSDSNNDQEQKEKENQEQQQDKEEGKSQNQENDQSSDSTDDTPMTANQLRPSDSPNANSTELDNVNQQKDKSQLSEEQWLRRIKDDPAGLLKRKFRREQKKNSDSGSYEGDPW